MFLHCSKPFRPGRLSMFEIRTCLDIFRCLSPFPPPRPEAASMHNQNDVAPCYRSWLTCDSMRVQTYNDGLMHTIESWIMDVCQWIILKQFAPQIRSTTVRVAFIRTAAYIYIYISQNERVANISACTHTMSIANAAHHPPPLAFTHEPFPISWRPPGNQKNGCSTI